MPNATDVKFPQLPVAWTEAPITICQIKMGASPGDSTSLITYLVTEQQNYTLQLTTPRHWFYVP